MTPKVLIYIPFYNEERFLGETLECCANQSYPNISVLLSDNLSTDGSRLIAEKYLTGQMFSITQPESHLDGVNHFKFLYQKATSEPSDYIMHLGGHDVIGPRYVEKLVERALSNPRSVLTSGCGVKLAKSGVVEGRYTGRTPKVDSGAFNIFNPYCVVASTTSNAAIHGLIKTAIAREVGIRYGVPGCDVLYIAEVSTFGAIELVDDLDVFQRSSEGGRTEYLAKHFGIGISQEDNVKQLEQDRDTIRYIYEVSQVATRYHPALLETFFFGLMNLFLSRYWVLEEFGNERIKRLSRGLSLYSSTQSFLIANGNLLT